MKGIMKGPLEPPSAIRQSSRDRYIARVPIFLFTKYFDVSTLAVLKYVLILKLTSSMFKNLVS